MLVSPLTVTLVAFNLPFHALIIMTDSLLQDHRLHVTFFMLTSFLQALNGKCSNRMLRTPPKECNDHRLCSSKTKYAYVNLKADLELVFTRSNFISNFKTKSFSLLVCSSLSTLHNIPYKELCSPHLIILSVPV